MAKLLDIRRSEAIKSNGQGGWRYIWLHFPIVAINNSLFSFNPFEDGKDAKEVSRATYVRQIDSEKTQGTYCLDFVAAKNLSDYVENELLTFSNRLVDLVKNDPKKFG